jgi:nicotinate-nucleotide adenylyltransferase
MGGHGQGAGAGVKSRRIGVFGGSFSPIHFGHLFAARAAQRRLKLDEVLFVPCAASAYGKRLLPAAKRLKLLRLALKGLPGFALSDIEIRRGGVSRSVDTIRELAGQAGPAERFFLLIGSDQVGAFPKWKEAGVLARLAQVCILDRPGSPRLKAIEKKYGMKALKIPQHDISASEIRRRLEKNNSLAGLLPPAVEKALKV